MNFSLGFVFGTIFGAMATVTIIAVLFMSKREPAEREYYCSVYEVDSNELVYDPSRRKPIDFSRGMNAAAETCRR